MSEENKDQPVEQPVKTVSVPVGKPPVVAPRKNRPQTNNWNFLSFMHLVSWFLATVICTLNFSFAVTLIAQGEPIAAMFNILYGLVAFWLFGTAVLGIPLIHLSLYELEKRNWDGAKKYLQLFVALVDRLHLHRDDNYNTARANLALIYLARGDYHESEELYSALVAEGPKKRYLPTRNYLGALYLNNLACVKIAQALAHYPNLEMAEMHLPEAEKLAGEALALWRRDTGMRLDLGGTAYPLQTLGEIDCLRGDYNAAEGKLLEAIRLNDSAYPSPLILPAARQGFYFETHFWLALLYLKQDRKDEADEICKRLLEELKTCPAPVFQHSLAILNLLGQEYLTLTDYAMAESVLLFAYTIGRQYPVHSEAKKIVDHFEQLLIATDRPAEVAEMRSWVRPVLELEDADADE